MCTSVKYNTELINRYVDEINLMAYDMHGGSFDDKTGHNAPLKASPTATGNDTYLNDVSCRTCT